MEHDVKEETVTVCFAQSFGMGRHTTVFKELTGTEESILAKIEEEIGWGNVYQVFEGKLKHWKQE